MSSLWTPGGEHPVTPPADDQPDEELDEAREAMEAELAEVQARLAALPAEQVVANHAMGLYELGAIHLMAQPPHLGDAALAIDAMACLVEGLGDRLGETAGVLGEALAQIRLAFVQVKQGR